MGVDPRAPCIIGVGQRTWHPEDTGEAGAPEPLAMGEHVARLAADDAGAARGPDAVLGALDSLQVVYCQSWPYDDPAGRLAAALGAAPRHRHYSGIGGTTPQRLVSAAAGAILRGELDLALVTGAEALDTKRRLKKIDQRPAWSHRDPEKKPFPLEAPFLDTEIAHEVFQAWLTFATFDVGRRAHVGTAPDDHRVHLGELLAPMTSVAAANPHAWFRDERSAADLTAPTAANRMVGYPYTKRMISVMDVDMAAALLVASHARADELGVAPERRVYLRGWCDADGPTYLAEHPSFHSSPAMVAASAGALSMAGLEVDDVAHLDLYSCFASSVDFALDALGLTPTDPRGCTVTGGLPFAGGPGSNYLTHSIATMAEVLRGDPGSTGMVSGVGMHMTKHTYAVYSGRPPNGPLDVGGSARAQAAVDRLGARPIRATAAGPATVATYSVVHGRDGDPAWALVVCDLPGGERCYAKALDPDLLAALERDEWVGRSVELLAGDGGVNLVRA